MDFEELLEYCQAMAIANKLHPTAEAVYRSICRSYSIKFSTELEKVYLLDPEKVILAHFESQLDEIDVEKNIEGILENIYQLEDPNYEKAKEEEIADFIQDIEAEEEERIKKGTSLVKHLISKTKKTLPKIEEEIKENLPTQGSINLSYLDNEEKEGQFEDDEG